MQPRVPDKINHTLVNTLICPKLSERAKGNLHYQIWQNNDDASLGIAISKNETSGGFSAELVKIEDILQTVYALRKSGKAFHATALKDLFIGKSANNPCFLAAILVDQKVVHPHPNTQRLLEVSDDAEFWLKRLNEASSVPLSKLLADDDKKTIDTKIITDKPKQGRSETPKKEE